MDRGNGSHREAMPEITQWLDGLRAAFGRNEIDGQIRKGLRGECCFHAKENGHELGTPSARGEPASLAPFDPDVKQGKDPNR